jgi:hypothetical protein
MTDPWDKAAARIGRARQQRDQERQDAERARRAMALAEQEEQDRAHKIMLAAITEATPKLQAFLAKRGPAARRLLAAIGPHGHVLFGCDQGGGSYASIYLHGAGLRYEQGTASGYTSSPTARRSATAAEAVHFFAYHGAGRGNPERVQNIVSWLTAELDRYAKS